MIVVSDASPLIALSRVRELELLHILFQEVVLPEAVRLELSAGAGGVELLREAGWLQVRSVRDRAHVDVLARELGSGEAEAIVLALELHADLLLMDERRGRAVADREGLRVTGVLGVLVLAKQHGLLPAIRPVIGRLVRDANLRVGDDVVRRALEAAGES